MAYQFAHGSGTEADPYLVETAEDLNGVRDYLSAHFKQVADIDLSVYENWEPIGSGDYNQEFMGIYDGNDYAVNNLTIDREATDYVGLFGCLNVACVIKNLVVSGNVVGRKRVGVLAGYIASTTITQCCAKGSVSGVQFIGGLAGINYTNGNIASCYSTASVSGDSFVGGLVGYCYNSVINQCYSIGNVLCSSEYRGGLMGDKSSYPQISSSYYDTQTSGQSDTGKGEPKTTAEMKQQATFVDWNFDTVWAMDSSINDGYPCLQWQIPPPEFGTKPAAGNYAILASNPIIDDDTGLFKKVKAYSILDAGDLTNANIVMLAICTGRV